MEAEGRNEGLEIDFGHQWTMGPISLKHIGGFDLYSLIILSIYGMYNIIVYIKFPKQRLRGGENESLTHEGFSISEYTVVWGPRWYHDFLFSIHPFEAAIHFFIYSPACRNNVAAPRGPREMSRGANFFN